MSGKTIKLQFKPAKGHKNHNDEWNVFTKDGQVGVYPEEIGKQKLIDFPLNFIEYNQPAPPKNKAKPLPGPAEPKKVEEEPDKSLKGSSTKTK